MTTSYFVRHLDRTVDEFRALHGSMEANSSPSLVKQLATRLLP